MTIAFPSSPTNGQTHTTGGQVWTFNGSAWIPPTSTAPTITHTPIAEVDAYAPNELTMRVVHVERSQDILPGSGPHAILVEEFLNASIFTTRYESYVYTGAVTSETVNQGAFTVVGGGSGVDKLYRARTKLAVPSGVFAAARVDPGTWSGACYACVGFFQDAAGGDFVQAQWRLDTGVLEIQSGEAPNAITRTGSVGTPDTIAGPTTETGPMWIGLILSYPVAILVTSKDGDNWDVQQSLNISPPTSFNDPTVWASYRPAMRIVTNAAGTIAISGFRTGYSGAVGHRDQKPITYDDGTPIRRHGKYWFTGTVASGLNDFRGNHMAIFSLDPNSYKYTLERHMFYNLTGTGTGAGYGGQIVYEESTGKWIVVANSWGMDYDATGIDIIKAETYDDLLSPGVSVLKADRITGLSSYSVYDSSIRKEDGIWKLVAIESNARTNYSVYGPSMWQGATLDGTMTRMATRVKTNADGACWTKIGGTWYAVAAHSTGFFAWDDVNLGNELSLASWSSALPAGLFGFGTFVLHPGPLVVDDGYRTRYLCVTFDSSLINSQSATRGGLLILEADEKPDGQEFAPKLVPLYMGT